jgi:hypothetical protein
MIWDRERSGVAWLRHDDVTAALATYLEASSLKRSNGLATGYSRQGRH